MRLQIWRLRGVALVAAWSLSVVAAGEADPVGVTDGTSGPDTNAPAPSVQSDTNAPSATAIQPAQIRLPPDLAEVVRLAESGLSDDVILASPKVSSSLSPANP